CRSREPRDLCELPAKMSLTCQAATKRVRHCARFESGSTAPGAFSGQSATCRGPARGPEVIRALVTFPCASLDKRACTPTCAHIRLLEPVEVTMLVAATRTLSGFSPDFKAKQVILATVVL